MSDTPRTPYLGRYLIAVLALTIGFMVFVNLVARLTGILLPGGAVAILPPMIAALHVGQVWGKERGAVPESAVAWRWAAVAGLVFLAVQLLLMPVMLAGAGAITGQMMGLIAGLVAGTTIMAVLVHRLFLVMGAKGAVARPKG
ncbi:ABZJ_00895 family protein [Jannaschia sp. M317]|uniref:ABZJ_00895 family protein n=1 Tax=Jannaschia sp. M317 TaxID=2867011 RepID=UPI0021A93D62|nr:ABZJ_00895 family protein [Jannaschia sp. M317]UWQ16170.1 ABZJ_00895 family protein [Jannaschia sp. M317]